MHSTKLLNHPKRNIVEPFHDFIITINVTGHDLQMRSYVRHDTTVEINGKERTLSGQLTPKYANAVAENWFAPNFIVRSTSFAVTSKLIAVSPML